MSEAGSTGAVIGRRAFLSTVAASSAAAGGCLGQASKLADPDSPEQVSLSIKTTPADDDPYAIRIAQRLADHLGAVGVAVEVIPMRNDQLLADVLIDRAFDAYVAAHPGGMDPDFLYPLLHSRYATGLGWQNPFGHADHTTDRLLDQQRRQTGEARTQTVGELQRIVANEQPFTVVAFPDAIRAVRPDRYAGWRSAERYPAAHYLSLRRAGGSVSSGQRPTEPADADARTLRVALTDGRATENLNPLAVRFRNRAAVTDLLYDRLALPGREEPTPWLAESWQWEQRAPREGPVAVVRLRENLHWHDGRPLTAGDVAFTYRLLADTSLGTMDPAMPAPRFRAAESLIAGTDPVDDRTIRLEFDAVHSHVAVRALSVPVLPEHEWRPRSKPATVAGVDLFDRTTEALAWPNMSPIGSGPFVFQRAVKDETLILDRFEEHFAWGEGVVPNQLKDEPAFDRLAFRIVPSDGAAVELLAAGEVDATADTVHARAVPDVVRSDDIRAIVGPSSSFYHVGYNSRRAPLSDRGFRRAVAQLLDKEFVVDDIFGSYAVPAASPLARSEWLAPGLEWAGQDPETPFAGDAGGLDVERARQAFGDAGYRDDGAGRLLQQ